MISLNNFFVAYTERTSTCYQSPFLAAKLIEQGQEKKTVKSRD